MRFHKNVSKENREFLREMLKKYEKETAMTEDERNDLHEWVSSGRSPYENGHLTCGENGWPLDFVSAERFEKELMEWGQSMSEEEKQELLHGYDIDEYAQEEHDQDMVSDCSFLFFDHEEELPFQDEASI